MKCFARMVVCLVVVFPIVIQSSSVFSRSSLVKSSQSQSRSVAEMELDWILNRVAPLMKILNRSRRSNIPDKREYYTKKYELINRLNRAKFNSTEENDIDPRQDSSEENLIEEGSGEEQPIDIHIHIGRNREPETLKSQNEIVDHHYTQNLTTTASPVYEITYYDYYDYDTSDEDGEIIGLRPPPPSLNASAVISDINKPLESAIGQRDSPTFVHHSNQTVVPEFKRPSLNSKIDYHIQLTPPNQNNSQRRESIQTWNVDSNSSHHLTPTAKPSRNDYGYPVYNYDNSATYTENYICCQRKTVLALLSYITLALLVAYLIVLVTPSGRKKRSESGTLDEELNKDINASRWISIINEIWDVSDYADDDVCTLKALCQMNRIASLSQTSEGAIMAFSSLPLSYLLHERHDNTGFLNYINASFTGYSGHNCYSLFESCHLKILQQ